MINEIGHIGASCFLQVIGARLVSIGCTQEVSFEMEKKDTATIEELTKFANEKEQKVIELSSSLKQKNAELAGVKSLQLSTEEELKKLKVENQQLGARVKELETELYKADDRDLLCRSRIFSYRNNNFVVSIVLNQQTIPTSKI
ncbi:uncharacterized protein LOC110267506 [Arachis ipaensis]|uniref:uncharacterized protein LOC110267506 n=1 Tax=Arachis ipaensis TaxID=130454 RepID=UPI000A2B8C5B|nr:uncharacterized protein LOC110267506 [Arachis ipaensis]